ncbi:pentatricopeptide repeat-containing protein At4g38150-like [Pistacia vera]|uniref:pentatricopeptide repeat-containing protein At4g38150-like n=1 Tax=Pistacia vera TaxID=55513 RepID=UPI0012636B0B|nr:pentatricopeptide repeat-containing protein At4g38150-like [Pistacia vera]
MLSVNWSIAFYISSQVAIDNASCTRPVEVSGTYELVPLAALVAEADVNSCQQGPIKVLEGVVPSRRGHVAQGRKRARPQPSEVADDVQSNENFLEKFKLSVEKKAENPSQNDAPIATQHKIDPPQDADEIFKKMKETGLILDAVAMLDGLYKDGLVQEAMKLFGLLRETSTIPEVVIYTAVVDCYCKAHKLDDAKRIFRKMQTDGISPNAFSYGVLIQGLCNANELEDAIDYCIEMIEASHSLNVITFAGSVDGLCREKGVEEAQSAIATLRQKGFLVNDKAVIEYLNKKAHFSSSVWEVIFVKKSFEKPF